MASHVCYSTPCSPLATFLPVPLTPSKPGTFLSYEASHSSLPDFLDFRDVHGSLIADRSGMFNLAAELINQVER